MSMEPGLQRAVLERALLPRHTLFPIPRRPAFRLRGGFKSLRRLLEAGMTFFCPITHSHPIAMYGQMNYTDHDLWIPFDGAMMSRSDALLVANMVTWKESKGIALEVAFFEKVGKPVYDLDPETLAVTLRP